MNRGNSDAWKRGKNRITENNGKERQARVRDIMKKRGKTETNKTK